MKTFNKLCGVHCFPNTEGCNGYCRGEAAAPPTYEVEEAHYEEKFIVINLKHITKDDARLIHNICLERDVPNNKYYVCNQDEPYAQKVIDIILEGETQKNAPNV